MNPQKKIIGFPTVEDRTKPCLYFIPAWVGIDSCAQGRKKCEPMKCLEYTPTDVKMAENPKGNYL